jgi:O-antigen/teichoic acid export membrane protein
MLVLYIRKGEFRPTPHPHFHRAKALLPPTFMITAGAFFSNLTMQADNFFVGLYLGTALGMYGMAYSMSFQFVQLLSRSLRGVMLPTFGAIVGDETRRQNAYIEAIRLTAFLSMPVCILPMPAVHNVVLFVFPQRAASIPLIYYFLGCMGFVVLSTVAQAAIQSRGRYRTFLAINAVAGVLFCLAVAPAARWGNITTVAITVSIFYMICGLLYALIAAEPCSISTRCKIIAFSILPFGLSLGTVLFGVWMTNVIGWSPETWRGAALGVILASAAYLLLAAILMNSTFKRALARLSHIVPARLRPSSPK